MRVRIGDGEMSTAVQVGPKAGKSSGAQLQPEPTELAAWCVIWPWFMIVLAGIWKCSSGHG